MFPLRRATPGQPWLPGLSSCTAPAPGAFATSIPMSLYSGAVAIVTMAPPCNMHGRDGCTVRSAQWTGSVDWLP